MRHPKDSSRYVHFLSDFPHLIKCLRNNLLLHDFNTPDGLVSLDAFKDVYAMDGNIVTLRVMHGIREAHRNPNNFEKMRVSYTYRLFGPQVTRGLRFYQQDVDPSRRNCIQATLRFFDSTPPAPGRRVRCRGELASEYGNFTKSVFGLRGGRSRQRQPVSRAK
ncbi:hypothetical protein MRX96_047456 [Rhipicephalus microplus]